MKYLALLSGGKDSCYNLLHCEKNGHELVAAASLGPEAGKEELDSYLYQTVGQDAIELVAQALDVPLYRQVITGNAVNQESEYGGRHARSSGGVPGDETEDLYNLLASVKAYHPDVQGVSVGAILSNYQRVRVEHVCRRLNLTPLCFLWQRNQEELLLEMIEAGMEAILIKVAGIGLTTSHLGKTLAEMKPTLHKLNTLYGSHICGEGGEYETLTIDCPLYKRRIKLFDTETVIHSDNDFATVAFLRIKSAKLEEKSQGSYTLSIPPLLDDKYKAVELAVSSSQKLREDEVHVASPITLNYTTEVPRLTKNSQSRRNGACVSVSDIHIGPGPAITIEEEVTQCFNMLEKILAEYNLQMPQVSMINLYISSIDLFASINEVYAKFFGVSPPARACVAVDLPEGIRVKLECVAFAESSPHDRIALHVQGLSYWAPANIGPYSQAVTISERVFISGQIGLIPAQLVLPSPRSISLEMALSCQHADRVVSALKENSGGGWVGYTQLAVYWLINSQDITPVKAGHRSLETSISLPSLFVVIKELPKNALVEKQVFVHTGRCAILDEEDGESIIENRKPLYEQGDEDLANGCVLHWEVSRFVEDGSYIGIIFIKADFASATPEFTSVTAHLLPLLKEALSLRLFHCTQQTPFVSHYLHSIFSPAELPPVTTIPCRQIASMNCDTWNMALCFTTVSNVNT